MLAAVQGPPGRCLPFTSPEGTSAGQLGPIHPARLQGPLRVGPQRWLGQALTPLAGSAGKATLTITVTSL